MRNIISLTLVFSLLVAALQAAIDPSTQQSRKWTAVTGQTMEGKLVNLQDDTVHLILDGEKTAKIKFGQLSADDQRYVKAAATGQNLEQLADGNKVVAVKHNAAGNYTLFVKKDGTLWGMGRNRNGVLGIPENRQEKILIPRLITTNVDKDKFNSGFVRHDITFFKRDNSYWKLGAPPEKIADNVRAAGDGWTLTMNGELWHERSGKNELYARNLIDYVGRWHWGITNDGILVFKSDWKGDWNEWHNIKGSTGAAKILTVKSYSNNCIFLKQDRSLWAAPTSYKNPALPIAQDVASVWSITDRIYYLTNGGMLSYYNDDEYEAFEKGKVKNIHLANNVISCSISGDDDIFFITNDGTLWGMGRNNCGELGKLNKDDDKSRNINSPIRLASDVASVAGFDRSVFFIKRNGTLWAMGDLESVIGQKDADAPVQIATDAALIGRQSFLSVYTLHFIKKDGTLWGVGYNSGGKIGDGTTIHRKEPVQVKVPETPLSVLQTDTAGAGY
ncbi:MAG: hypothetical protein LBT89_04605 [Planctomycetaceae bacterium]|jgi:hypothetical protein|nr:hypothetical protein [Planctomycetaceae bacterium]